MSCGMESVLARSYREEIIGLGKKNTEKSKLKQFLSQLYFNFCHAANVVDVLYK